MTQMAAKPRAVTALPESNQKAPNGEAAPGSPLIEMRNISVAFGGVRALDDVSVRLLPGEVHAFMGENGAGKSTLIKALTGVYGIDEGVVLVAGAEARFRSPAEAQEAGISTVYQEVNLCANLTVAENMLLGREPRRFGTIDSRAMCRRAQHTLDRLGLDIDPRSQLGDHPIAVQQLVAIARAVDIDARVLILDEPTSSLDADEVEKLFEVMRTLREHGVAIVFVSHFLDQVFEISDRMTILRNGRLVGERLTAEITQLELVQLMIGRDLEVLEQLDKEAGHGASDTPRKPVLKALGLSRKGSLHAMDLTVFEGEVVGVAGLLGSGRTELARLLFGADTADTGSIEIRSTKRRLRSPRHAIDRKIAFSSENRGAEGVIADLSVADNIILALQASRGWVRPVPRRTRDKLVQEYIKALDIRPTDPNARMGNLSGGNQQKVLLARWLVTQPDLLILDEPTRGIDIGAKTQIQQLVAELAGKGMSVVFISAELEEVIRLSDRLVVMREHRKIADQPNDGTTVSDLLQIIAAEARAPSATDPATDPAPEPTADPTEESSHV
ncbi:sugar ABC transporter ATP-binding protein [Myroides odoratimimus subsp. xuanwuensis]